MRRLLLPILSALSLLLLAAILLLWLRSYVIRDVVTFASAGGNSHLLQSILGRLHILSTLDSASSGGFAHASDRLSPDAIWNGGMSGYPLAVQWRFGVIWQTYSRYHWAFTSARPPFVTRHRLIVIPYWLPAGLLCILPLMHLMWRRTRRRPGLCPTCGYDLRATPERCPECGIPIKSA